jgi:hypothetical protein
MFKRLLSPHDEAEARAAHGPIHGYRAGDVGSKGDVKIGNCTAIDGRDRMVIIHTLSSQRLPKDFQSMTYGAACWELKMEKAIYRKRRLIYCGILMKKLANILMAITLLLSSEAVALKTFANDTVSIDSPVNDDVFASGSVVNINAPVESAVVAGGIVNINASVAGDMFVAGSQVLINADIGGTVVATAGRSLILTGNVSKNAILAGGIVNIHGGPVIGRDALIAAMEVYNDGKVNGILKVGANTFQNDGIAGQVEFNKWDSVRQLELAALLNLYDQIISLLYHSLGRSGIV